MMRIAITPPEPIADEPRLIELIISRGWDMVHLRHPEASADELRSIIDSIEAGYHPRIRLHSQFSLLSDYRLGGAHLNRRWPSLPEGYTGPHSRSCHSVSEIAGSVGCDYVTLSPIFDSISKQGYAAVRYDLATLPKIVRPKVIALGGITPERIGSPECSQFDGYAVLGYLFGNLGNDPVRELSRRLDQFD